MLKVTTLTVTPFQQNARIVRSTELNIAAVIDPGGESERILRELDKLSCRCEQIWLTHSHLDHCGGVNALLAKTGAKLYAHPVEAFMRSHVKEIAHMYGLTDGELDNCPEPDHFIQGGESLYLGSDEFQVFFTPGHSPGHVIFYNKQENILLAGDTIFAGSIGRTDLPGGDYDQLMNSIHTIILKLPLETKVLAGHGPDTTIAEEKKSNPFLQ